MKIEDIYSDGVLDISAEFAGDSKIVYLDNSGKVRVVDFNEKKETFVIDAEDYVLSVKGDEAGKNIVVLWDNKIAVYDTSSGEILHQVEINSENSQNSEVVCLDEKLFYLEQEESKSTIKIVDINSKNLYEFVGNFNRIVDVKRTDEHIYILAERFDNLSDDNFSTIIAIDNAGNLEWQIEFIDVLFYKIDTLEGEEEPVVLAVSYSEIRGLDSKTGGEKFVESISEGIEDVTVGTEGFIQIITTEGRIIDYYPFLGNMCSKDYLYEFNEGAIGELMTCQGGLLLLPLSSNYLIKYDKIENEDKTIYEGNIDKLIVESTTDKEESIEIANPELIDSVIYTDNRKIAFITYLDMSMDVYDVKNEKVINSVSSVDCAPSRIFGTDKEGNVYIASESVGYCFDKDYNLLWQIDNLLYVDVEEGYLLVSGVRRHIVGGANRILISVLLPPRLCSTGTCRRLSAE